MIKKNGSRERKLTQELFGIFLIGLLCAVLCTIFLINRRFGSYAWVLKKGIIEDSRKEYAQWLKKEAPAFSIDQPEEYMPYFEKKADDYTWMGIYEEETGQYIDGIFAKILDNRLWGSWSWSDTDIAAQSMELPVEVEVNFRDGTARIVLMTYQSLKFFAVYYLLIVILDSALTLAPILVFIHRRMKYLAKVRAQAAVMGKGEMEHPVTVKGWDEIAALAAELDSLRIALKTSMENERQAHMDNQELIRALSHDLRTPLTTLNGYLEILSRKKGSEKDYPRYVCKCLEKTEEIRGMSDKMFEYALVFENPGETSMQEVSLRDFAAEIREQAEYLSLQGFSVDFTEGELPDQKWVANPFLIKRLAANLCSNILRYGDREKTVELRVSFKGDHLKSSFTNGIAKETQAAGSGVGLKSAAKIAELHGGCLTYGESENCFRAEVRFPAREMSGRTEGKTGNRNDFTLF